MARTDHNLMFKHWMESSAIESDGKIILPSEFTHCQSLMLVCRTIAIIATTKDTLFRKPDRVRKGRAGVVATKVGRKLQACLEVDPEAIQKAFPQHRFNPYYSRFVDVYRSSLLWRSEYARRNVENLNEFVEALRARMKRDGFMKSVSNHERGALRNAQRARRYIHDLYKDYAKLLHVRIDLSYVMPWPREGFSPVSAKQMKAHRAKLMRYVRKTFKEAAVGHLWTVEYGDMKGPHFHMLLIFNGHKVRQGITIAQQIGEQWKTEITGGAGLYWNVNKQEDAFEAQGRRGIGLIAHSDEKRRANLILVTEYLVKVDLFVRMNMPGFGKTFGRGKFVARKRSKAGRKRKNHPVEAWVDGLVQARGSIPRDPPSAIAPADTV